MKRIILIGLMILSFISCSINDKELKDGWWKYCGGDHFRDALNFNSEYLILKNDTIFIEETPKAIIISKTGSFLGFTDRKIIIKFINSNKKGTYCQK